jgi:hypothetical protein
MEESKVRTTTYPYPKGMHELQSTLCDILYIVYVVFTTSIITSLAFLRPRVLVETEPKWLKSLRYITACLWRK